MRLVYLSPVPWASFAQRPHQFVEWFHQRSGGEVLWIDPYPTRLPVLSDFRPRPAPAQAAPTTGWLEVIRPRALPIEPLPGSGWLNRWLWSDVIAAVAAFQKRGPSLLGVGKPSELALQLLARDMAVASFYDAMDDFPYFYQGMSRTAMARRERLLSMKARQVLVSSNALRRRFGSWRRDVTLVPNACAPESLPTITQREAAQKCLLGFVGTIGAWFDWEWVFALARQNPTLRVRLIGPLHVPPPGPLPDNIELLPACDHTTAMQAMTQFAAGLIPFRNTRLTESVDPIKYYEYRALGLPVISTRFGEMALRGDAPGVILADAHDDLAETVRRALTYRPEPAEIQVFRLENSWEARFTAAGVL